MIMPQILKNENASDQILKASQLNSWINMCVAVNLPSTIPSNPLELLSNMVIFNLVPPRIAGLELISSTAVSITTFVILPTSDLNVRIHPILMTLGLAERVELTPSDKYPQWRTASINAQNSFIMNWVIKTPDSTLLCTESKHNSNFKNKH